MNSYKSLYNNIDINADSVQTDTLEIMTNLKIGLTTIEDKEVTTDRILQIPNSGANGEFVITNGDVDQIIGGNNTFTGSNTFDLSTTFKQDIKVDTINEYTLNNGILIDGVKIKDGEIIDTSYSSGVLHSDNSGVISSSSIINNDVDTNANITVSKLAGGSTSQLLLTNGTTPTWTSMSGNININSSGSTTINNNVITNAMINTSAGIKVSKLSGGNTGEILISSSLPYPSWTPMSGHININSSGSTTIQNNIITNDMINSSANISYSKINLYDSIINNDVKNNTLSLQKLNQIANNKILGNISGALSDVSLIDSSASSVASSVMLRDSSGNTGLNELHVKQIYMDDTFDYSTIQSVYLPLVLTSFDYSIELWTDTQLTNYINFKTHEVRFDCASVYFTSNDTGVLKTNAGYLGITTITNSDIASNAAISYSKLNLSSSITNNDLAGSIAYNKLVLTGSITNNDLAGSIAYNKLVLTGSITNNDLAGSIAYNKLVLTGSITNNDLAGSIAYNKLVLTNSITDTDISPTSNICVKDVFDDLDNVNDISCNSLTTPYIQSYEGLKIENLAYQTSIQIINNAYSGDIFMSAYDGNISLYSNNIININSPILDLSTLFIKTQYKNIGVLKSDAYGILSSSLLTNSDVDNNAAIQYSKLNLNNSLVSSDITSNAITTAKILDNNVTYAKIQQVNNNKVLGNVSGSAANVSEIDISVTTTNSSIVQRDASGNIFCNSLNISGSPGISMDQYLSNTTLYTSGAGGYVRNSARGRGTQASPSPLLSGDILDSYTFSGVYNTNGDGSVSAKMNIQATQNFAGGALGTGFYFSTCANNSSSLLERVRIDSNGITFSNSGGIVSCGTAGITTGNITTINSTTSTITTANITTCNVSGDIKKGSVQVDTPIGVIQMYIATSAPNANWMVCDGTAISRTTYSALFALISTAYGVGDGSTTFNLPDMRERMPYGYKVTTNALGTTGGAATKTLSTGELPSHTHDTSGISVSVPNNYFCNNVTGSYSGSWKGGSGAAFNMGTSASISGNTGSTGSGTSFSLMNPYISVNYIIKVL